MEKSGRQSRISLVRRRLFSGVLGCNDGPFLPTFAAAKLLLDHHGISIKPPLHQRQLTTDENLINAYIFSFVNPWGTRTVAGKCSRDTNW